MTNIFLNQISLTEVLLLLKKRRPSTNNDIRNAVVNETLVKHTPDGTFETIIGHREAKCALIQSVVLPIVQPQVLQGSYLPIKKICKEKCQMLKCVTRCQNFINC